MRKPLPVSGVIITGLLVAGVPLLSFNPSFIDDRGFVPGTESRDTGDILRSEFDDQTATPMIVLVGDDRVAGWDARIHRFATRVSTKRGVASVSASTGRYFDGRKRPISKTESQALGNRGSSYMLVVHDAEPLDDESIDLVDRVRSMPAPFETVRVTGEAANVRDVVGAIVGGLPLLVAFVGGASFLILIIQFGSVAAPLIAVFVSALSLSALCGAMIWAFQAGHYSELVGLITTDTIHVFAVLFTVCFAFGLSMDYQVFLLSRIQEEHERGRSNREAIALGLGRSGRVVTAAAILIAIVFLSAGLLGSEQFSKSFGLGMGLVVLLDAFVIRGTLVPALMRMAGGACWWGPAWLRGLRDRIGLSEVELGDAVSAVHESGTQAVATTDGS